MEVKDYIKLPYTRLVQEMNDESGHYFYGRILELDGCQSTGDTLEELYESLNEAMEGYIESKLENNLPVPTPESAEKYVWFVDRAYPGIINSYADIIVKTGNKEFHSEEEKKEYIAKQGWQARKSGIVPLHTSWRHWQIKPLK